ncbi:DUF6843 domain-containing protein [Dyadobacter tibetensis]|uniref:DUF6843 domain-containing protein n=1 Tax=Dyadobacter tibetensis TaxID=1211851 RepID=UPI0004723B35|nr:hypothetical protein [Dyadobacter tibetensis]
MKNSYFFLISLSLFFFGCYSADEEIIIVPKGFKGNVLIIFNQPSGVPAQYEGGKRLYKIPPNGVLKTQLPSNDGWSKMPMFYYEEINKKNLLPYYPVLRNVKDTSVVFAYGGTVGSVIKNVKTDELLKFMEYHVGNKREVETSYNEVQKLDILKLAE